MDAATFMGDVGAVLVGLMLLLMVVMNYRIAKDVPSFIKSRRSLARVKYPKLGSVREYVARFGAALNNVFGPDVQREARVVWFFYQFGGFLILANIAYALWYKIGLLF